MSSLICSVTERSIDKLITRNTAPENTTSIAKTISVSISENPESLRCFISIPRHHSQRDGQREKAVPLAVVLKLGANREQVSVGWTRHVCAHDVYVPPHVVGPLRSSRVTARGTKDIVHVIVILRDDGADVLRKVNTGAAEIGAPRNGIDRVRDAGAICQVGLSDPDDG